MIATSKRGFVASLHVADPTVFRSLARRCRVSRVSPEIPGEPFPRQKKPHGNLWVLFEVREVLRLNRAVRLRRMTD